MSNHLKLINIAHNLASKNLGKTFPNPTVGCVIAKNNEILSFYRLEVGEGVEKKDENFADEVMAQIKK